MNKQATAHRLRAIRQKRNMSRAEVSASSGLAEKTIQRAEEQGTDKGSVICALAKAYGVHPIELAYSRHEILDYLGLLIEQAP